MTERSTAIADRSETQADPETSPRDTVARVLTEVFAPAVLVAVLIVAVAVRTGSTPLLGLLWALVAAGSCVGLPVWFVARGAARGQWDTHHVRGRKDRLLPLSVAVASIVGGLAVLRFGGAPRQLVALVLAMLFFLVLVTAITQLWKISIHAAVSAGTVAILITTFGPWWWLGIGAVAAVSWSRYELGDHTPAQLAAGAALGAATVGGMYAILV